MRRKKPPPEPSKLSAQARAICAAAAAAVRARDEAIAGIEVDGDPPEVGDRTVRRRNRIRS